MPVTRSPAPRTKIAMIASTVTTRGRIRRWTTSPSCSGAAAVAMTRLLPPPEIADHLAQCRRRDRLGQHDGAELRGAATHSLARERGDQNRSSVRHELAPCVDHGKAVVFGHAEVGDDHVYARRNAAE